MPRTPRDWEGAKRARGKERAWKGRKEGKGGNEGGRRREGEGEGMAEEG